MTMLSEAATSVPPACRAGLPTKVVQPINSSNQTSGTDHTPSLLSRSSGEKVADRPVEGVAVDSQPHRNSRFSSTLEIVSVLTVLLGLWLNFGSRSIDPIATSEIAEAVSAPASPIFQTIAIQDITAGQFVTIGLPPY